MAQLCCKDLTVGYNGKAVLSDLSFQVESGQYLSIIGENGSGKTTLMKTILGLHRPMKGCIETGFNGGKCEIGYLPQQTSTQQDFPASVKEVVLSGCISRCGLRPFYNREERQLAKSKMEQLSISHLYKKCYRELSGGQQQRVLLARALCATGNMILLDEPVSGLDSQSTMEMYHLIEHLNREHQVTVIMISHDVDAAIKYSSHILHLGKKVFFGKKDDFIDSPAGRYYLSMDKGGQS